MSSRPRRSPPPSTLCESSDGGVTKSASGPEQPAEIVCGISSHTVGCTITADIAQPGAPIISAYVQPTVLVIGLSFRLIVGHELS